MAVIVDTVVLLQLVHKSLALADERNDEDIRNSVLSPLSALTLHLRNPRAEMSDAIAEKIRFLEHELKNENSRPKSKKRRLD